jgi:predicted PurR-regulated permease PerM
MSKLSKYILGAVATAAILFIVWYFSSIVAYILISAVLATIGKPLVDALSKLHIKGFKVPKWLAAVVTLIVIWGVVAMFFTLFIPFVFSKMGQLSQVDIPHILESFREPILRLQEYIQRLFSVNSHDFSIMDELSGQLSAIFSMDSVHTLLSSVVSVLSNTAVALFSITFITFFFLKQDGLFMNMLIAIFPKKHEQNIVHAMNSATRLLIRYFTGILAESSIILILLSGIFLLFGFSLDTAIFIGVIMGVMNVIPYIGPLIGAAFCVMVGVVTPMDGYTPESMAMIIAGTIICVKLLDDFVLQPWLYSNRVNAHPLEIFLVILIAGSVAGVVGMLLAIPAYNVIRVFAKEFFNNFRLVQKLTENM